jgi:TonB-dependent SusC/RagA subfamily outer membrane receptor
LKENQLKENHKTFLMPFFALYLLKLTIGLSAVWLFYRLFLRQLTFFTWNRWYLLGYSLLSFLIPLIDIQWIMNSNAADEPAVIRYIPVIGDYQTVFAGPASGLGSGSVNHLITTPRGWIIFFVILALGSVFLLTKLLGRWLSLRQIRKTATLIAETGTGEKIKIYQVDQPIVPFSFGNAVYINQQLHTEKEWEEIILHEYVHVRQRHTIDIVLAEILCIVNWYNPFVWLIRYSIRQNLEFIADEKVLQNGVEKKGYQYHLLKVIGEPRYRLANNFNFSSLKKRIAMMNSMKSARLQLIKFLFILPMIATLLVAFRGQVEQMLNQRRGDLYINISGIIVELTDYHPMAGVTIRDKRTGLTTLTDEHGFYKIQIPAKNDSILVNLMLIKKGYDTGSIRYSLFAAKKPFGHIEIGFLRNDMDSTVGMFVGWNPGRKAIPLDPSYEDAVAALKETRHTNDEMALFFKMQKTHPEVSLFYTSEDHLKQIVIYKDGRFEKYGYPAGPSIDDMEKKFGRLSEMITGKAGSAGGYYIQEWQKISEQAEKEFHTDSPNVRHIIFPGDSRVIAVPIKGKPEMYDMDNSDPKERPAFEKLYGKLPASVPEPPAKTDTLPNHIDVSKDGPARPMPLPQAVIHFRSNPPQEPPLYLIDGIAIPGDSLKNLAPNDISRINVLKGDSAVAKYGEKGRNGVVEITTKKKDSSMNEEMIIVDPLAMQRVALMADTILWNARRKGETPTLVNFVDGVPAPPGLSVNSLIKNREIAMYEFSSNAASLQKFGLLPNQQMVNFVTKAHNDDPNAHILKHKEPTALSIEKDRRQDVLYTGTDNLLKIGSRGVMPEDLVVTIGPGGSIEKRNGLFYAKVSGSGNIVISVYIKQKDGSLTLLDYRYFRIDSTSPFS